MFTGIVEASVEVRSFVRQGEGARMILPPPAGVEDWVARLGQSVAVSGACLTVAEVTGSLFAFDVVQRTLEMTTLGRLEAGQRTNLEHAARFDSLIGGHIVQGHVDGVGRVRSVDRGDDWRVRIAAPEAVAQYLCDRGSITVNGVSLTIARVQGDNFEVALIPTTLAETTLDELAEDSEVNLEADLIAKMVAQQVQRALGTSPTSASGNQ